MGDQIDAEGLHPRIIERHEPTRHVVADVMLPTWVSLPDETRTALGMTEQEYDEMHQKVYDCLTGLFPYSQEEPPPDSITGKNPQERVWSALTGTSKMRIGKAPEGAAAERNLQKIEQMMGKGEPISLVSVIGTAKLPDGTPDQNHADLADFAAMQMVYMLDERVRAVYPQGIQVRYFYEDAVGDWLFGPNARESQDIYWEELQRMNTDLSASYGREVIHLVKETNMLELTSVKTSPEFIKECRKVEPLFKAYLEESQQLMDDFIQNFTTFESWDAARKNLGAEYANFWEDFANQHLRGLDSWKNLQAAGWNGLVPPEMRAFYVDRFATNANNSGSTIEELREYMAHYYASTLVKSRLKTPYLDIPGEEHFNPKQAVKLAFIGLAPGIPPDFRDAIQMRAVINDSKRGGIDNSTAPWRGKGGILVIKENNGELRVRVNICSPMRPLPGPQLDSAIELPTGALVDFPINFRFSDQSPPQAV
jgi:hypothetical protein